MMDGADPSVAMLIDESRALEHSGDVGAALCQAQKALEQAQDSGESEPIAAALSQLAHIEFRLGNYNRARELAQEALTWAAPDSPARCRAWLTLGNCAAEGHSLDEAETFYRQAADLARRIGNPAYRARALHNLANGVYFPRGLFDLTLSLEDECAQLVRQHGLENLLRFPLFTTARICQLTGQQERARAALDELGRLLAPDAAFWGYHAVVSALLALDEGETDTPRDLLRRALAIAEKVGEPGLNGLVRLAMSRCLRLCGDPSAARGWADDAVNLARRVRYQHLLGQALVERGRATWLCGDAEGAVADLRQAQEVLTPLRADFDLARTALLLAAILQDRGDPAASAVWLETVRRIALGGYAFLLEQERTLAFPLLAAHLSQDDETVRAASAKLLSHLARIPPPPLRVRTLGRFEVRQGARVVPDAAWRQRRAGELFRLLLVSRGHSLPRDVVLEALWPDQKPTATMSFHQATSALRRALEPDLPDKFPSRYLKVEEGQVTLRLPIGSWVDLEAFEEHARQGRWEEAVALYEGDLFPADRYADWAAAPRERLSQQFVAALLALARQKLAAGHLQEALAAARRALEADPWQESAVLVGMQACLALGDRAGALRLYRNLEQTLREDLGIAPQRELQELYRSIQTAG